MEEVVELISDSPNLNTYKIENVLDPHDSSNENLFKNLTNMIDELEIKNLASNEKLREKNSREIMELAVKIRDETWTEYKKINMAYSLEGDKNKWIACLVYIIYYKIISLKKRDFLLAEKNDQFDSKADEYQPVLSLYKLLLLRGSSLPSFLCKLKKLNEIVQGPNELRNRITQIEMDLNVSCIVFSKYKLIFSHLFAGSANCKRLSGLRELFEFGWMLFVLVKESYPQISKDLVNSYHLLICSVNFMYQNIIDSTNSESLNILSANLLIPDNSLIDYLCKKFHGQTVEAKTINEHYFKHQIVSLHKQGLFRDSLKPMETGFNISSLVDFSNVSNTIELVQKLNKVYENAIAMNKEGNNEFSVLDCHDPSEIDQRLFLDRNYSSQRNQEGVTKLTSINKKKDLINWSYAKDEKDLLRIKMPNTLEFIHDFSNRSQNSGLNCLKDLLSSDDLKLLKGFEAPVTLKLKNSMLSQLSGKGQSDISELDASSMVDYLVESVSMFYYKVLGNMLHIEKNRLGAKVFEKNIKKFIENYTLHKSVLTCCFEIICNFTIISSSNLSAPDLVQFQMGLNSFTSLKKLHFNKFAKLNELDSVFNKHFSNMFKFPWSLSTIDLTSFDFFRIIELFIKSCTINNTNKYVADGSQLPLIDKGMIKYLKDLEDEIVHSRAWSGESPLWRELAELRLDKSHAKDMIIASEGNNLQLKFPFPFFEDVCESLTYSSTNGQQSQNQTNKSINSSSNNGEIILNLTPNPVASSASFSSPVKNPTITRVVTGATTATTATTSVISANKLVTLKPTRSKRLINLSSSLSHFFRKFYSSANSRVRDLVNGLDLIDKMSEISGDITQSTIATSSLSNPTNSQQTNENQELMLRTIWNIFEYSMCFHSSHNSEDNSEYLICDRHIDQLILCSIYLACKVFQLTIKFTEIIRVYRSLVSTSSSEAYRHVLICHQTRVYSDLVRFYNEKFITTLRPYVLKLIELESLKKKNVKLQEIGDLICLSPVPKLQTPTTIQTHFTPVKLAMNSPSNIFISPGRLIQSINQILMPQNPFSMPNSSLTSNQSFLQPFQNQRNKLKFAFNDLNPTRSLKSINEMIKRNEVRLKPSTSSINKTRLFQDVPNIAGQIHADADEIDGDSDKKANGLQQRKPNISTITSLSNLNSAKISSISKPSTSFLSSVVGSRLGYMSKNSSNLVTMVINSNSTTSSTNESLIGSNTSSAITSIGSTPSLGSSFARKLQNIQTERLN